MNFLQLLRHATLVVRLGNYSLLVDPMLSTKGEMDPIANSGNDIRIPMLDLPYSAKEMETLIRQTDAILLTHLHRDHWDLKAIETIPKNKLIFCQPADEIKLQSQGFLCLYPVEEEAVWNQVTICRTGGQHGTGEIGKKMAPVSGYVLTYEDLRLYIAGDTIWCDEVQATLLRFAPDYTVVNAGAAEFVTGGPITMTERDVQTVLKEAGLKKVIAVHMDAINHCRLSRQELRAALQEKVFNKQLIIPQDGETIIL